MTLLEESLAYWRELGQKPVMAGVQHDIGQLVLAQGDARRARALFRESLTLFQESLALVRELGVKPGIVRCLEGLAGVAEAQGQPVRATRLFGAAEALRDTLGLQLSAAERAEWERNVATVRAQLDKATFTAAWKEGRAITLEQAIAYALEPTVPPDELK